MSSSNFAFFLRIFDELFSGFRAKFQKRVTSVAVQSILRKQIRKLPKTLKSVKIIHYYSILFICVLSSASGRSASTPATLAGVHCITGSHAGTSARPVPGRAAPRRRVAESPRGAPRGCKAAGSAAAIAGARLALGLRDVLGISPNPLEDVKKSLNPMSHFLVISRCIILTNSDIGGHRI